MLPSLAPMLLVRILQAACWLVRHPQLALASVGFNSHLDIWFIATFDALCESEEGESEGRRSGPQYPQTKCVLECCEDAMGCSLPGSITRRRYA